MRLIDEDGEETLYRIHVNSLKFREKDEVTNCTTYANDEGTIRLLVTPYEFDGKSAFMLELQRD